MFDYGCGLGDDVRLLDRRGIPSTGWDPGHAPDVELRSADVVNLGYVLNVIETPKERVSTLQRAWKLARRILVVGARLAIEGPGGHDEIYNDGYLTRIGTFQKYFEQNELRQLIESVLSHTPVAAGPGVFYVFCDRQTREEFLARRSRRRSAAPRVRKSDLLYEEHKELLESLIDFVSTRGRLPAEDELASGAAIIAALGSLRQAFAVIKRATGRQGWTAIRHARSLDLLVYLALAKFDGRAAFSRMPRELQRDIRAFFSSYKEACKKADTLLFAAGEQSELDRLCRSAGVGKETPSALYVHRSALNQLPAELRVYEGCAAAYIGAIEGANIIKLHRQRPAISYLSYPTFDTEPHPALARSLVVRLDGPRAKRRDYSGSDNPPILHRKEEFVADDHPLRERFERLTRQEERWSLYANPNEIGTRNGWNALLERYGFCYRGHRLVRKKG